MSTTALFLLLLADFLVLLATGQPFDYPTATPTTWTNSPSLPHTISYPDGTTISALRLRGQLGPSFAFGFFSPASTPNSSLLAIFIVYTNSGSLITRPTDAPPQLVWSPNCHHLVGVNATLQLSPNTGLVLRDSDGSLVWSTNTTARISSLNVTHTGNLVLLDNSNVTVWSSFDHPTDSMLIGQSLKEGQRLTANVSATNSTQGRFYLTLLSDGLYGYIESNPPQLYYQRSIGGTKSGNRSSFMTFTNGSLQVFALFTEPGKADMVIQLPTASSVQYMKLESDGHLRIHEWGNDGWKMAGEVMNGLGDCQYPTVCGSYGVCSRGQCSCPNGTYFKAVDARQVNLGCAPVTPLSCRSIQDHRFVALDDVSYFNYLDSRSVVLAGTNADSCRQACLNNCSCKAALFQYGGNSSHGSCYLPSELFSLMNNRPSETHYNSTAYIKVQINPTPPNGSTSASPPSGETSVGVIVGSIIIGGLLAASLVIGIVIMWLRRKRANEMEDEDHFDHVSGMPTRFSYQQLKG